MTNMEETDRERKIRDRAYSLWEAEGSPSGRHDDHWHAAAREVDEAEAGQPSGEAIASEPAAEAPAKPRRAAAKKPVVAPEPTGTATPAAKPTRRPRAAKPKA